MGAGEVFCGRRHRGRLFRGDHHPVRATVHTIIEANLRNLTAGDVSQPSQQARRRVRSTPTMCKRCLAFVL